MPSLGQVTARQAVTSLDIAGVEPITLTYYPERISPRIMRQYMQLVLLPTIQPTLPADMPRDDAKLSEDEARALIARVGEHMEQQVMERIDSVAEILSTLLASWNLTEDDGQMVALTPERLSGLGFALLSQVFKQVMEAVRMGEPNGTKPRGHL